MNILGTETKSVFLKQIQAHKLHQEFIVAPAQTVRVGQPVKLNATGEITAVAANDNASVIIGISVHNAAAGETATIGMKAVAIVWARSAAAITTARPVKFSGVNGVEAAYGNYSNVAEDGSENILLVGWALDPASAINQTIRVAIY